MSKVYDIGIQSDVVCFIRPLPEDKTLEECIAKASEVNALNVQSAGAMNIPVLHRIFVPEDEIIEAALDYAIRMQESTRRVTLKSTYDRLTDIEGLCEEFAGDLAGLKTTIGALIKAEQDAIKQKTGPGKPLCAHCDNTGCGPL